ncbi:acyl-CoA dehydrogenase family protein [Acidobacteria bacterium AH-259-D05]|nr:acyl-CoA dehydrogenase family protein [Acidobacteria bacterium AH-259-D05]
MNFEITAEQQQVQSLARQFAQEELAPIARQADETAQCKGKGIRLPMKFIIAHLIATG